MVCFKYLIGICSAAATIDQWLDSRDLRSLEKLTDDELNQSVAWGGVKNIHKLMGKNKERMITRMTETFTSPAYQATLIALHNKYCNMLYHHVANGNFHITQVMLQKIMKESLKHFFKFVFKETFRPLGTF